MDGGGGAGKGGWLGVGGGGVDDISGDKCSIGMHGGPTKNRPK